MKSLNKILWFLLPAVLFLSCNKIDDNDFLIYSGSTATWVDGEKVSDTQQKAFVEKYTGMRCVNCPKADTIVTDLIHTLEGKVVAVSIHPSGSSLTNPYSGSPDLRTEVGGTWNNYFGIEFLPSVLVNRAKSGNSWDILTDPANIPAKVSAILSQQSQIALELASNYDASSRKLSITANLEFLQTVAEDLTITLMVTEDSIIGEQANAGTPHRLYNYEYNHVFRGVITDLWGADIDANGQQGTCRSGKFNYVLNENWRADKCHVVAIISNKNTRYVLQAAETSVIE